MTSETPTGVTVKELLEYSQQHETSLDLKLVTKNHTLDRALKSNDINRPGMNLFGYFEFFAHERVQIFGRGESTYLEKLSREKRLEEIKRLFEYPIPCIIFSHSIRPPEVFIQMAESIRIPVMVSSLATSMLINGLHEFFSNALAPREVIHGVMLEIFGLGVLLEGKSGVGKSECALELIERGHRFIADDVVDLRAVHNRALVASSSRVIAHHMEIRGIGIINIAHLFGVGAILSEKDVNFVVHLDHYEKKKTYDRLGMDTIHREILGIRVPMVEIPVQPGSNIPILVETATMNQRLKMTGYNPAREFTKKVNSMIEKGEDIF